MQRVRVADEKVGIRRMRVGAADRGEVQLHAVAGRESVLAAAVVVGHGLEAQRRIVSQRRTEVAHREDWAETAELAGLAGWRTPARSGADGGALDLGQGDERRSHRVDLFG